MALNARGHEVPDPTPVEVSTTLRKPESMEDMIRRFVRVEGSRVAANNDQESFEEANDFEPDEQDEDRMETVYTVPEMIPELNPDGFVEKLDGNPETEGEPLATQRSRSNEDSPPGESVGDEADLNSPVEDSGKKT